LKNIKICLLIITILILPIIVFGKLTNTSLV